MDIIFDNQSVVVFDLDDTLYQEVDYLKSAYRYIADYLEPITKKNIYWQMLYLHRQKAKVFENIIQTYQLNYTVADLLRLYRFHSPKIQCFPYVRRFLSKLKASGVRIALITDGRTITQTNKLKVLGIDHFFDKIIISESFGTEKPNSKNYLACSEFFGSNLQYYYIGDNFKKDFITPNQLGWETIALKDRGMNIHTQQVIVDSQFLPKHIINHFKILYKKVK